jgi:transcriptional regulator with XRE-family HTH domain
MVAPRSPRRLRRRSTTAYPALGALLRARREQLERSQAFVAERAGIDQSTLSLWEQGVVGAGGLAFHRLVTYLGIDRADIEAATKNS